MRRVAFDLDETLGVPLIEGDTIAGFCLRPGCAELLARLSGRFELVIWTVSSRRYLDKVLAFGLGEWFERTYSWDEQLAPWKDVRRIGADWLIDDSRWCFGVRRLDAALVSLHRSRQGRCHEPR